MGNDNKRKAVLLKQETVELMQTIKSCFTLARRRNISYDDLIECLIRDGLKSVDPRVYEIYKVASLAEEEAGTDAGQDNGEETTQTACNQQLTADEQH